jgi:hypothetical protein
MSDAEIRAGAVGVLEQNQRHVTHRSKLLVSFIQPPVGAVVRVVVASIFPFAVGNFVHIESPEGSRLSDGYVVEHVALGDLSITLRNNGVVQRPAGTVIHAGHYVARYE